MASCAGLPGAYLENIVRISHCHSSIVFFCLTDAGILVQLHLRHLFHSGLRRGELIPIASGISRFTRFLSSEYSK